MRNVIVENFSVNAGETVFGEVIPRRKVHSVSSLSVATKINKYRLFGLARSTGLIPKTVDRDAYNQQVFPAEKAERVIGRIANSIPQNQVKNFIGSSTSQIDHFVRQKLIESITPLIEEGRGQLRGNYNRDDLNDFLERTCKNLPTIVSEVNGYASLSSVSRMRTDTGQVMRWLLDGELPKTCLLRGVKGIDHLRFCCSEVATKIKENQEYDMYSLTSVSAALGIPRTAVRRLISTENGGPWLTAIDRGGSSRDAGSMYFSRAEIEHFREMYLTPGLIGRMFGINWNIARRVLKESNIDTVCDPSWVGAEIYRRDEVLSIAQDLEAAQPFPKEGRYKRTKEIAKLNLSGKNEQNW